MAKIIAEIVVCLDCMQVRENGETDTLPNFEPWGLLPGADVAMAETGEDPDYFGTTPCEACGEHLAGDRFDYVVFSWGRPTV